MKVLNRFHKFGFGIVFGFLIGFLWSLIYSYEGTSFFHETLVKKEVLPQVYVITPTYRRQEQLADLTRLGYTLKHVPNLLWLLIEDADSLNPLVADLLKKINVPFVHLNARMPEEYRKLKRIPRGVSNRNLGLEWTRKHATDGAFYFADDDNTYDPELFEEIRKTVNVSMFPVGVCTPYQVSSPIVRDGKIIGFYDGWIAGRKFPVDMAGFAVGVKFLLSRPNATMSFVMGKEEEDFLRSLDPFEISDIELLASNCTKILVWHTRTQKNAEAPAIDAKYNDTNLVELRKILV